MTWVAPVRVAVACFALRTLTGAVLAVLLLIACSSDNAMLGQVAIWRVAATPEVKIGLASGDPDYLFEFIISTHLLPSGDVLVADRGSSEVRVYTSGGLLETAFGGPGRGPGEFINIMGMWLTSEGKVAVWDPGLRRITQITLEDGSIETARVEDAPGNLEVFLGSTVDDRVLLASLHLGPRRYEQVPDRWILGRYDLEGSFRAPAGSVNGMWRYDGNPVPFSPLPWVAIRDTSVFVADGYGARIDLRNASGLAVDSLRLDSHSLAVGDEQAWDALDRAVRRKADDLTLGRAYLRLLDDESIPRDHRIPAVAGLLVDDSGYLWVKRYDPARDALWLRNYSMIPAPGGDWLVVDPRKDEVFAEVSMPDGVVPFNVTQDKILGVATDYWGVQRVVVHRLTR
jgi:hypothetical protein